jgi:hypothetical protein
MRRREVFEIIEEFNQAKNKKARVEVLQKYQDVWALKDLLRGTFDEAFEFNLPEGTPPYTENRPESTPSTFLKKHKEIGIFIKGGHGDRLPSFKREQRFVQLLESIHPQDAKLVLGMKDRDLGVKYLTKKLVEEAFPNLIPN